VRVAFGARPAEVVGVIRDAVWPVAFGLVAGLAGAYYATRIITSFLFQSFREDKTTHEFAIVKRIVGHGRA